MEPASQCLSPRTVPNQLMLQDAVVINFVDFVPKKFMPWRVRMTQFVMCKIELCHRASLMLSRLRSHVFSS